MRPSFQNGGAGCGSGSSPGLSQPKARVKRRSACRMRSHPKNASPAKITIMRIGRILGAVILLILSLAVAGYADEANAAFKRGVKAEAANNYDEAFQAYGQAHSLKPKDARYFTAFTRLRFYAAIEHMRKAQSLRDAGKLQEAIVEFQRAAEIDPTNFTAKSEAVRTHDLLKKQARAEEAP